MFYQMHLPEGWKLIEPQPYCENHIKIIDSHGTDQVNIRIKIFLHPDEVIVTFFKLPKKLPKQIEQSNQDAIVCNDKPVCYPGYFHKLYCSYDEIVEAIES